MGIGVLQAALMRSSMVVVGVLQAALMRSSMVVVGVDLLVRVLKVSEDLGRGRVFFGARL
jgi:uncharacterized membrane protein YiaA